MLSELLIKEKKTSLGMYLKGSSLQGYSNVLDTGNNKTKTFLITGYLRRGIAYGERIPYKIEVSNNNSSWSTWKQYPIEGAEGANAPINETTTSNYRYYRLLGETTNGYTGGCVIGMTVIGESK